MNWKSPKKCELCQKDLSGFAEVESEITDKFSSITVKESLLIDFAFCKICGGVICKQSCFDSRTGYCKPCSEDGQMTVIPPKYPFGSIGEMRLTDDILSSEIVF
jgi:hypothetical protein